MAVINGMDLLTQDYLHKLKQQSCGYHTRTKVATAIRVCHTERRQHKDNTIILEPLVSFLQTEKGKILISSCSKHWAQYARQSVQPWTGIIIPGCSARKNTKNLRRFLKNFGRSQVSRAAENCIMTIIFEQNMVRVCPKRAYFFNPPIFVLLCTYKRWKRIHKYWIRIRNYINQFLEGKLRKYTQIRKTIDFG